MAAGDVLSSLLEAFHDGPEPDISTSISIIFTFITVTCKVHGKEYLRT
jgi:hypothetical protein